LNSILSKPILPGILGKARAFEELLARMSQLKKPDPFLNVRVHDLSLQPGLTGLCVGYEREEWRASQFAQHILEWIPEFALKHSELADINSGNAMQLIRNAAKRVYESGKFEKRGEFGELFLHAALRQVFNTLPAISKIFYKTARNETVKGFDAVHVVGPPDNLQLWLGEAKFYSDIDQAVNEVVSELKKHTETNYLRDEFLLIKGKIDPSWPHAAVLQELLSENRSLDEIFTKACIAVLLTYDSICLTQHVKCDAEYAAAFETEIRQHHATFTGKDLPKEVEIHLFLLPLNTKKKLLECLDEKLKSWQKI